MWNEDRCCWLGQTKAFIVKRLPVLVQRQRWLANQQSGSTDPRPRHDSPAWPRTKTLLPQCDCLLGIQSGYLDTHLIWIMWSYLFHSWRTFIYFLYDFIKFSFSTVGLKKSDIEGQNQSLIRIVWLSHWHAYASDWTSEPYYRSECEDISQQQSIKTTLTLNSTIACSRCSLPGDSSYPAQTRCEREGGRGG